MATDPKAEFILRKYQEAKTLRSPAEAEWRQVAERLGFFSALPGLLGSMPSLQSLRNPVNFIDVKAHLALERYGAMLEMMLTPRMQKWHGVKADDESLNKYRRVKVYFEAVRDALFKYRYAARAGFSTAQQETYLSHGALGAGVKFVTKPKKRGERGLRYRAMDLSRIYLLVNAEGFVCILIREIDLNARQSLEEFGREALPKEVTDELDKQGGPSETTMFRYLHMVSENENPSPYRLDHTRMAFKSCYVHEKSRQMVAERGFESWPYPISRAVTMPGQIWGKAVAGKALGAINNANSIKVTLMKQGHRTVDPVLLTHDDGVLDQFDMTPGAQNSGGVNAEGKELVKSLPIGRVDVGHDMLDREHRDINDLFYVTLFQILIETPEMTATEVVQRLRERGALLAPTMGKIEDEDLAWTIEREIDLLAEQGLLPPPPPELVEARGEYQLTFDNAFTRSQQGDEVAGFMRMTEWLMNVAGVTKDPRPLRRMNFDAATPEIAERQNVPQRWIRSDEEMAALDEQDQQAQQTQTAIEAAPALAGLAKAAGQMSGAGAGA